MPQTDNSHPYRLAIYDLGEIIREELRKGMSYPKVVTNKAATGAGKMTKLSPKVESSGRGALLSVSGTTCSFPGPCSSVTSNSAILIAQRANLDC